MPVYRTYWLKIAYFPTPVSFGAPVQFWGPAE